MPETNPTPVLKTNTSKKYNEIRPLQININITGNNIRELPFGWGEGEPPTPEEEEDLKIKTK